MIKRASRYCAPDKKSINKIVAGFTIIETMLFLAIAGLIFAGLVAGTNGTIRQQRYKDSVQGFVDDLRDLYSLVENTQVLNYGADGNGTATCGTTVLDADSHSGRGRSGCSVYGIYAIISPTYRGRENVEAYWVTGVDQALVKGVANDKDFFGPDVGIGEDKVRAAISIDTKIDGHLENIVAKQHSILWGADVRIPCATNDLAHDCTYGSNGLSDEHNQVALFIYRSPITGSINTLTYVDTNGNRENDIRDEYIFEIGKKLGEKLGSFLHNDISLCITGGSGMGYSGGIRMVTIDGNGTNTNAVRLIEADSEENKCNN